MFPSTQTNIVVTSHAGRGASNHRQIDFLFNIFQFNNKEYINALHYWFFVMGNHRWPADSTSNGPSY